MPDPDFEIRGGGGGSSRPLDKEGALSPIKIFLALRASVSSKNRGGPGAPWVAPLDPALIRASSWGVEVRG